MPAVRHESPVVWSFVVNDPTLLTGAVNVDFIEIAKRDAG